MIEQSVSLASNGVVKVAGRKRGDSYFYRGAAEQCIDILQCASRVVCSAVTNTAHEGS